MEEIKRFTKSTERKFKELEMTLQNISMKNNPNYNNNENSPLLLEILKNCISNLEKEVREKEAIINFLLKQKSETNNNTSLVNKTVTENDEILEEETPVVALIRNKKKKIKQNLQVRQKKSY